jgi:hypothetical protein
LEALLRRSMSGWQAGRWEAQGYKSGWYAGMSASPS